MKTNKPIPILLEEIRQMILTLPPERRRQLSNELISFLLFDSQSHSTISADLKKTAASPTMSAEQIQLIKALGGQTRRLNDLMGDDPYLFG